jgi:metal-sulfur cluster biosynthetic enzyme
MRDSLLVTHYSLLVTHHFCTRCAQLTTPDAVQQALAGVIDPLLGQNLVDLGMVEQVRVARGGRVAIRLSLPSQRWPVTRELVDAARYAVGSQPGVVAVDVQVVDGPPWTPYRLAPALKAPLGLPAVEPPDPSLPPPSSSTASNRVQRSLQRLFGR